MAKGGGGGWCQNRFKDGIHRNREIPEKFWQAFVQFVPGLRNGLFPNQKSQFWKISGGIGLENVTIFYGNL
jgi:hypothetical protein